MKNSLASKFFVICIAVSCVSTITLKADITGFGGNGTGWTLNGYNVWQGLYFPMPGPFPTIMNDVLSLTDINRYWNGRSAFFNTPQPIGTFTASFTYQNLTGLYQGGGPYGAVYNPADGIVFTIQNQGPTAIGTPAYTGSSLAYQGIAPATGIALNLWNGHTVGIGYAPTSDGNGSYSYSPVAPVDLLSLHPINVTITYDGTNLHVQLVDTVSQASFSTTYAVNLVQAAGGSTAYVGFTGATGAGASDQRISNFSFTTATKRPVIVIPGTMGSVLYSYVLGLPNPLWISPESLLFECCDQWALPLALADNGISPAPLSTFQCNNCIPNTLEVFAGANVTPVGIFDGSWFPWAGANFYGNLISTLQQSNYLHQTFAYDWRLDFTQNAAILRALVEQLAPTPADKVDIVAHSQGGLVVRTYLSLNAGNERIGKIIYLGTPHLGSTKSYAILKGWQAYENYLGFFFPTIPYEKRPVLHFTTGTFLARNFPSMYEMLPRYPFMEVDNVFEDFDTSYGLNLPSQVPANGAMPNESLAEQADTLWDNRLQGATSMPSDGSFAINGSGQNTLRFLVKSASRPCLVPINDTFGDGTVPNASAIGVPGTTYFYVNKDHGSIPSDPLVNKKIVEILQTGTASIENGFQDHPFSSFSFTIWTCSPVDMQILDGSANLAGLDATGNLRQDIPNSQFFVFPENQAAFLPATQNFTVLLRATSNGTFSVTFNLCDPQGSTLNSFAFTDVPISINSRAQVLLNPTLSSQILQLDVNGDGTFDYQIQCNQMLPPASYVSVLINVIPTLNLPGGISTDLTSVLTSALSSLKRGDTTPAQNQLNAFQNKVSAQTNKSLTASQANLLADLAARAVALLQK